MYCPRLDHFVRLNPDGTVGRCGHMVDAPEFSTLEEMDESLWLRNVKLSMHKGLWPKWCERCKQTEQENNTSIRLNAIKFDQLQKTTTFAYLQPFSRYSLTQWICKSRKKAASFRQVEFLVHTIFQPQLLLRECFAKKSAS